MRKGLMNYPGDEGVKTNLLSLYDKAYALKGYEALPSDWKIPEGADYLAVSFVKRYRPAQKTIVHRVNLSVDFPVGSVMEKFRLIQFPDRVLIDREKGIGTCDTEVTNGVDGLWCSSASQNTPHSDGLYLIDFQVKGKPEGHGWFIASRMAGKESPEIILPLYNQILTEQKPTLHWKNFVSSEYRSYEKRKLRLAIAEVSASAEPDLWNVPSANAGATSVKIDRPLPDGAYELRLSYKERHRFGGLTISRDSDTVQPFSVKTSR